ncbi:MAG: sigma 54-interacting transcriptional regulator [Nitrospirales bacterium]|nr:sigma 54-interacting transcriptional regulator [Nitrospirales bacterium]
MADENRLGQQCGGSGIGSADEGKRLWLMEAVLNGLPQSLRVVDRDLNLIYANRAARARGEECVAESDGKCYSTMGRNEPCESCPVTEPGSPVQHQYALMTQASAQEQPADGALSCSVLSSIPAPPNANAEQAVGQVMVLPVPPAEAKEERLGRLIGRSDVMHHLFEMIHLVAPSDATVLLEGESGTGKEMVAQTVHELSRRRDHPFVVIDCGALPETLLESELFGHVRGAFTGAVAAKLGLFEEADGGTIFLDEIADMSPALQAKLLRVIQEGEIKPVGGTRRVKVDVRIIAASNRPMVPLVAAKAFREDLYYRLAVIPMTIPPLRRRREDVPLLIEAFVAEFCARYGRNHLAVPPEATRLLMAHAWPGNVRELRHVIERAVVTASGEELAADRLFADLIGMPAAARNDSSLSSERQDAVRLLERGRIVEALRQANGNRALAARSLKISRASFYNKLSRYQIHPSMDEKIAVPMCYRDERVV